MVVRLVVSSSDVRILFLFYGRTLDLCSQRQIMILRCHSMRQKNKTVDTSQDEGERECLLNVSNESKGVMLLLLSEVPILFFENGCQL
jgi:hypothetical protein